MDLGAFDLNTLTALRALLEEANLTRAGAKVGMAQPAMSGVLGRYRRHFNDELLVRVGREHELTPLARDLLPQVREALRGMREALRVADVFDPRTSERLFTVTVSDYAMTVLLEPLRRRVRELAPSVRLAFVDLPPDLINSPGALLRYDVVVGPLGFGFAGEHTFLFHDRLVCLVDRDNPYLRDGGLDLDALRSMPHAVTVFHEGAVTPIDRVLGQLRVVRRVALQARGFLPLPFAVAGTEAVAIVPERLARRFVTDPRLRLVEPPFGFVDMLETAWWHPTRAADAGHRWLVGILEDVAAELAVDEPAGVGPHLPSPVDAALILPDGGEGALAGGLSVDGERLPGDDSPRLDHVGLNVRDLDAMAAWYVRAFGYVEQVRFSLEELDLRIVMLVDAEGRRFELLARSAGAPGLRAGTPVEAAATWGFGHVAFVVPDLVATHARLIRSGGSAVLDPGPSPQQGWWFAWVHDPEGNLVELIGRPQG